MRIAFAVAVTAFALFAIWVHWTRWYEELPTSFGVVCFAVVGLMSMIEDAWTWATKSRERAR